jgi:large subunit ribosomal protein L15
MSPVNLDTIQSWIDQNRIDPSVPITLKELTTTRAIHGIKDGVKLLARGASTLTTPINIVVSRASQSAIEAVEAAGGTVTTRFYTKDAIRRIKMNTSHPFVSMKWDPEALGNPALAAALPEGVATDPAARVKGVGFQYRLPDPTGRKELEYYRDPKHRGYLSHLVKEGEGPSLYFKPMPVGGWAKKEGTKSVKEKRREENRLW